MLRDLAPAKINLFLHVLGRREDGYHLLESLVGFADFGDDLALEPGRAPGLVIDGPMAAGLVAEDDNLVLRAAGLFAEAFPGVLTGRFHLTKNLPVASGIGGGSSDAAAALRLLARANAVASDDPRLMVCARALGADVPVCMAAKPRLMRGIGHDLGPALAAFEQPAVLVNPGVGVETSAVFKRLGLHPGERFTEQVAESADKAGSPILDIMQSSRNDLEAPAAAIAPVIADVLAQMRAEKDVIFARMSGSGATCFALLDTLEAAENAARSLGVKNSHWWIKPCRISFPH